MILKMKQYANNYKVLMNDDNLLAVNRTSFFLRRYKVFDATLEKGDELAKQPLYMIKKRYWRILARYDVLLPNKERLFSIKRKFSPFRPRYKIVSKNEAFKGFKIIGNVLARNYQLKLGDDTIATIKKEFKLTDVYELEINDEENYALVVAIAVALDNIHHKNRNDGIGSFFH